MGLMDKVKDVLPGSHSDTGTQGQQSEYSKPGNDDYNNPLLSQNQGMMSGGDNTNISSSGMDERGSSFDSSRGSDLGMGSPKDTYNTGDNMNIASGTTGRFSNQDNATAGMGMSGYGNTRDDESGEFTSGMGGRTGQSGYGDDMNQSGNRMGGGGMMGNTGMGDNSDFNTMSGRGDMTGDQLDTASSGNRTMGGMGQTQGYGQSQSDY